MTFSALLDDRFEAVGAQAFHMAPARAAIAAALTLVAGFSVGWTEALAWAAVNFTLECWVWFATRRMARRHSTPAARLEYFWATLLGVPVWTVFGLMLWLSPRPACELAAIAFWVGQLLYAQNFCVKSPVSMAQIGSWSILAPLILPMVFPHFHGADQVVVMVMLGMCVAHAINAALMNIRAGKELDVATAETLRAREQAEVANQAKTDFLAAMSHEIRTPLNGVLGMAQAMAAEPLSPTQAERLKVIGESGTALLAILNDILDISKVEAGMIELEDAEFDLVAMAHAAQAAFEPLAVIKGLDLVLEIDPAAQGLYRGDCVRVRQVLSNLISNAVKFTGDGSVHVAVGRTEAGVRFSVTDTGAGVASDRIEQLFDKFVQADASTTREYGGTGLGLAICRELCRAMGGDITATSELGKGSCFIVELPLPWIGDQRHDDQAEARDAAAFTDRPLRILAAEDNAVNQLVLRTLLGQAGVEPMVVANGAEAVAAWERGGWDLILMDVQMPVMDGPTATREIRRREAEAGLAPIPIIALTANAMTHQTDAYRAAGMTGFVAKPIEVAQLYAAIAEAVRSEGEGGDEAASAAA